MSWLWRVVFVALAAATAGAKEGADGLLLEVQGSNVFNVGRVHGVGETNIIFRFKNIGEEPLTGLRLLASCPCIKATYTPEEVLPGEMVDVTVSLALALVKKGDFRRGVTLYTDKRRKAEAQLFVTGSIVPLVAGLPDDELVLDATAAGIVFTNAFTLNVSEGRQAQLLEPVVKAPPEISVQTSLTASEGREGEYALSVQVAVLTQGVYRVQVEIPVAGENKQDFPRLRIQVHGGTMLLASPKALVVDDVGEIVPERIFRLMLRTNRAIVLEPEKLTWRPQLNGMRVVIEKPGQGLRRSQPAVDSGKARRSGPLRVTLGLTSEAFQALLNEPEPAVSFFYPDCADVKVQIQRNASDDTPAEGDRDEK